MNPHEPSQRKGIEWLPERHRSLRIKQMLYAVESGVLILIAAGLAFGSAPGTIPILGTAAVALLGMIALLRMGYVLTAAYLTLGMMTLACSLLMWMNAGLRDTSLLGFTAILYFTTVMGSRKLFYGYLAYAVAFFGSSRITGECCTNLQKEVVSIPVAVGHSLDHLDFIVYSLQYTRVEGMLCVRHDAFQVRF